MQLLAVKDHPQKLQETSQNVYPIQMATYYNFPKPDRCRKYRVGITNIFGPVNLSNVRSTWKASGIEEKDFPKLSVEYFGSGPGFCSEDRNDTVLAIIGSIIPSAKSHIKLYLSESTNVSYFEASEKALAENDVVLFLAGNTFDETSAKLWSDLLDKYKNTIPVMYCGDGTDLYLPSALPQCVSTGASVLYLKDNKYDYETAYNFSGGGRANIPQPKYQKDVVPEELAQGKRTCPDLVINGGSSDSVGYRVKTNDGFMRAKTNPIVISSAMIAGFLALSDSKCKMTKRIYKAYQKFPSAFNDITLGTTVNYPALVGYDLATGLGSFNGAKLIICL